MGGVALAWKKVITKDDSMLCHDALVRLMLSSFCNSLQDDYKTVSFFGEASFSSDDIFCDAASAFS
jgi:hypothetical protein